MRVNAPSEISSPIPMYDTDTKCYYNCRVLELHGPMNTSFKETHHPMSCRAPLHYSLLLLTNTSTDINTCIEFLLYVKWISDLIYFIED